MGRTQIVRLRTEFVAGERQEVTLLETDPVMVNPGPRVALWLPQILHHADRGRISTGT